MRFRNFACALMSVAFRIELNGLIIPSVLRLVHSCAKLMAVEGGEVCKQVGDEGTSLRWLSYLAEQSFSCSIVNRDKWELRGQYTLSPLRPGKWALKQGAGPYMGWVAGCLWLAVGHTWLSA